VNKIPLNWYWISDIDSPGLAVRRQVNPTIWPAGAVDPLALLEFMHKGVNGTLIEAVDSNVVEKMLLEVEKDSTWGFIKDSFQEMDAPVFLAQRKNKTAEAIRNPPQARLPVSKEDYAGLYASTVTTNKNSQGVELKRRVDNTISQINEHSQTLEDLHKQHADSVRLYQAWENSLNNDDSEREEFLRITELQGIEYVQMVGSIMTIETKPLMLNEDDFEVGSFIMEIDLAKQRIIDVRNKNPVGEIHHPHLYHGSYAAMGQVCWGNMAQTIQELLADRKYPQLVSFLLVFFSRYGGHDGYKGYYQTMKTARQKQAKDKVKLVKTRVWEFVNVINVLLQAKEDIENPKPKPKPKPLRARAKANLDRPEYGGVIDTFRSSRGEGMYEARLGWDNQVYCTCVGWKVSRKRPKVCTHMRQLLARNVVHEDHSFNYDGWVVAKGGLVEEDEGSLVEEDEGIDDLLNKRYIPEAAVPEALVPLAKLVKDIAADRAEYKIGDPMPVKKPAPRKRAPKKAKV